MKLLLYLLACLCTQTMLAGEFEREGLESRPSHKQARWYTAIKNDSVNIDSVMLWMRLDQERTHTQGGKEQRPSLEQYDVQDWIGKHIRQANAEGWIVQSAIQHQRIRHSLKSSAVVQADASWRNIGPFTWDKDAKKETGSEGIGVIRCMAVHPSTPETIVVGTISAGVWWSANGGQSWIPVTDQLFAQQVYDLVVAPSNPLLVYAALDVGLARSTDGGRTFSIHGIDHRLDYPNPTPVEHVTIHPTDANTIIIAYNNGLQKSTDGGLTWTTMSGSKGRYWELEYAPSGKAVFAVRNNNTWSEFVRFANGAFTFPQGLPIPRDNAITHRALIATSAAAPSSVWVMYGGSEGDVGGVWGMYKSTNDGTSFSHVCCGDVDGPEAPSATNPNLFDYDVAGKGMGQITWDMAFAVSNVDTTKLVVGGIFPYVSTNGGVSWKSCSAIHYDVQDAMIVGQTLWICNDGGLQRSDNLGATFVDRSSGICAVEVWGFGQSLFTNVMALGAYHLPIFVRDDKTYSANGFEGGWYPWSGADAMMADVNPDDDSWLYVKPWSSVRAKRSTDKSVPPTSRALGIDLGYLPFSNVAFHPNKTYSIVAADHSGPSVVRTDNNAESWRELKKFSSSISHVRIAPSHPSTMVVIADAQLWYTDDGDDWVAITPPTSVSKNSRVVDVAFDATDHRTLWIAFGGWQSEAKVAYTTDAGNNWVDVSHGLSAVSVNAIHVRSVSDGDVLVGTGSGVMSYDRSLKTWAQYGSGLPRCGVYFLQADETQGLLRIGTTRGVWETSLAPSKPRAHISVATDTVRCYDQEVVYSDRSSSLVDVSSWRSWSFPGGVPSSSTDRQPRVHYAEPGLYSAILRVGNKQGVDSTILENAVLVLPSECDVVDPQPGGCADVSKPTDFVTLGTFKGETRTFTFTGWVKPNGIQPGFSAILCTDALHGYVGEIGMQIVSDSNEVGYLWKDGQWWWGSGLHLTPDQWNHVAMIIDGDNGVTVMVNGVASHLDQPSVAQDLSKLQFTLGTYHYWESRNLNAQIDEVRLYNRALTVHEVRTSMHHPVDPDDATLLGWYQFNESGGSTFFNARGEVHGAPSSGAERAASTIPYGHGSTDTVRLPAGDVSVVQTLGLNARVKELQGRGLVLTSITRKAPLFSSTEQLLQPRYFIAQTLDSIPYTLESVAMDLRGLIGRTDATTRTYHLWTVDAYSPLWQWKRLDANAFHDASSQSVTFKLSQPIPARSMFCVTVDGGPVGVPSEHVHEQEIHCWPMPASDVIHVRGLRPGTRYAIINSLGEEVASGEAATHQTVVSAAELPNGMYTLVASTASATFLVVH